MLIIHDLFSIASDLLSSTKYKKKYFRKKILNYKITILTVQAKENPSKLLGNYLIFFPMMLKRLFNGGVLQ
jgi:hypothetical protein